MTRCKMVILYLRKSPKSEISCFLRHYIHIPKKISNCSSPYVVHKILKNTLFHNHHSTYKDLGKSDFQLFKILGLNFFDINTFRIVNSYLQILILLYCVYLTLNVKILMMWFSGQADSCYRSCILRIFGIDNALEILRLCYKYMFTWEVKAFQRNITTWSNALSSAIHHYTLYKALVCHQQHWYNM